MCNLYLAWLVRSRWSLLFGRLRPTPFAQLSPFLLLGRTRRHVLSLPCSTIFSSYLLLRVPFLFFGLVISSPGPLLLLHDAAHHAGLPFYSLKGRDFRIGATSSAAAAGLPDWLIKVGWSSDCYQLYIRTPKQVLLSAAPRKASSSP